MSNAIHGHGAFRQFKNTIRRLEIEDAWFAFKRQALERIAREWLSYGDIMGWVKDALKELAAGHQAQVRPSGGSMRGRIESGQLVTIAPVPPEHFEIDDVVFVEWQRNYLLHLVKDIKEDQVLIGNNVGKINGWVSTHAVKGIVVAVDGDPESY